MLYFCISVTAKQSALDELNSLKGQTESLMSMKTESKALQEKIETLMKEHKNVTGELNRYQTRNDHLIKQNKVSGIVCKVHYYTPL